MERRMMKRPAADTGWMHDGMMARAVAQGLNMLVDQGTQAMREAWFAPAPLTKAEQAKVMALMGQGAMQ